jgi:hypothetical protein
VHSSERRMSQRGSYLLKRSFNDESLKFMMYTEEPEKERFLYLRRPSPIVLRGAIGCHSSPA